MSAFKTLRGALAFSAIVLGTLAAGGLSPGSQAVAGPLPSAGGMAALHTTADTTAAQPVHYRGWGGRRWGGIGIYIGPGYGYYPRYYGNSYYDYGYSPRYSYYDYGYYRPYRYHRSRWAQERFRHPLGRR